ncbi:uncharacterized protein LOC142499293 [Ascaphus truei]|uniref:uncharacterized protein LOC142499293 n=1 Tax=Ascaphus truei TaxID=8439 RepID=UPI003F5A4C13
MMKHFQQSPVRPTRQEEVSTPESSVSSSVVEEIEHNDLPSPVLTQTHQVHHARNQQDSLAAIDASEARMIQIQNTHHQEIMGVHQTMASEMRNIKNIIGKIPGELHIMNITLKTFVNTLIQGNQLQTKSTANEGHFSANNDGSFYGGVLSPQTDVQLSSNDDFSEVRIFHLESPTMVEAMQTSSTGEILEEAPEIRLKKKKIINYTNRKNFLFL